MDGMVTVSNLLSDDWDRLRKIRLASLQEDPDVFGGSFEAESQYSQAEWQNRFEKLAFLVASKNDLDIAMMYVETFPGDHDATCWVGGCWSDPRYRGQGALRAIFNYLDQHAVEKGWIRQGLGVWTDNLNAIKAYDALGFKDIGFRRESEKQPGRFYMHMVRDSVK